MTSLAFAKRGETNMNMTYPVYSGDIIHLNVGGTKFSTSHQTLTKVPDSFFTALLSGGTSSLRDESGAIFLDRDPMVFNVILNYLRTNNVDLSVINTQTLLLEAEYYRITPLIEHLVHLNNQSSETSTRKDDDDTTPGTIDFTFIVSMDSDAVFDSLDLTDQNEQLRRHVYIAWTNSTNTRLIYENVKKQVLEFSKIFSLQFNPKKDILHSLLKCNNTVKTTNPMIVSTEIRILSYPFFVQSIIKPTESKRTCLASDVITFGRPHIYSHPCN